MSPICGEPPPDEKDRETAARRAEAVLVDVSKRSERGRPELWIW
ncbi:hypothetical protein [Micromonospora sp. CPCC 206061]